MNCDVTIVGDDQVVQLFLVVDKQFDFGIETADCGSEQPETERGAAHGCDPWTGDYGFAEKAKTEDFIAETKSG